MDEGLLKRDAIPTQLKKYFFIGIKSRANGRRTFKAGCDPGVMDGGLLKRDAIPG